ncbi:MAG: hypothetical protein AAGG65_05455 [Pseudomonadota bacterium]
MIAVQHWPLWLSLGALGILAAAGAIALILHLWRRRPAPRQGVSDTG